MVDTQAAFAAVAEITPALIKNDKIGDAAMAAITLWPLLSAGTITPQTVATLHQQQKLPAIGSSAYTLWQIGCDLLDDPTQAANVMALVAAFLPASK